MNLTRVAAFLGCASALSVCSFAADVVLHPAAPTLDRPTLTSIGIRMPVTGDDNYNAAVSVRYRKAGSTAWLQSVSLYRLRPETVVSTFPIAAQFAGAVVDLRAGSTYEIELHISDPDGFDQTISLTGATRPVPVGPATPRQVNVNSASTLATALATALPGDVITLADGVYSGLFGIMASGTLTNPIVIRGTSRDNTIVDGGNCLACNVLEVYGSYVQIENLTLRNAERALRFQGAGTTGNVLRRARITNVKMGIGAKPNQTDYYIADNIIEGRLPWPLIYSDDGGAKGGSDGITMSGNGHIVAHNQISGFADSIKNEMFGWGASDIYGNDILWCYDNAVELDEGNGNIRFARNRLTNTYMPVSIQPGLAGPFYIYRNVSVNSVSEQLKIHGRAVTPLEHTNGLFVFNNTFVSSTVNLRMDGDTPVHHVTLMNNLFIGPSVARFGYAFNWYGPVDDAVFNYNGYFPDGAFTLAMRENASNLAGFQALGREVNGKFLQGQIFANGMIGGANWLTQLPPPDMSLATNSPAVDSGAVIPGISSAFQGQAPDMGALESGCPVPVYGVRAPGVDETNEIIGCVNENTPLPAVAASLSAVGATSQSATTGLAFASPFSVLVKDTRGGAMTGIAVTFTVVPGASGASGSFAGGITSVTVVSNSSGISVSPALTANGTTGSFTVTAASVGLTPVVYSLTNVPPLTSSIVVTPVTSIYDPGSKGVPLQAQVIGNSSVINGGTVTFSLNGVALTTALVGNGQTVIGFVLPTGKAAGVYTLSAQFNGWNGYPSASAGSTLTISKRAPVISWAAPAPIASGTPLSVTQLKAAADVPGAFVYTPAAGTVLPEGKGQRLSVAFTPTDAVNYSAASASTTIDVGSAAGAPTSGITVAPIVAAFSASSQGVTFAASITSNSGVVNGGTVAFTLDGAPVVTTLVADGRTAVGIVMPAGKPAGAYTIVARFSGWNGYPAASGTSTLTITGGSSGSVIAVTPITYTYSAAMQGVTFAAQISGCVANGGTVAFSLDGIPVVTTIVSGGRTAVGIVMPAGKPTGTYTLSARFGGWNTCVAATGTAPVTVVKRTPVVTWPTPAAIVAGTPLSATQLNAVADTAGTFFYTPSAGTVLSAGYGQMLSAAFAPTDTANYTTASARTYINVSAGSSLTTTVTVTPIIAKLGNLVLLQATIAGSSAIINDGTVVFSLNDTPLVTALVRAGRTAIGIALPAGLSAGSYTLSARFSGWNGYPGATGTAQVTLLP